MNLKSRPIYFAVALLAVSLFGCRSSQDEAIGKDRVERPSSVPGWKEIKTSGFALSFPGDWSAMDITSNELSKRAEKTYGGNSQFEDKRKAVEAGAKRGDIKLMVRSDAVTPSGNHSVGDVIVTSSGNQTLDNQAQATVRQLMKTALPGTDVPKVDVDTPAGRFVKITHFYLSSKSIPYASFLYLTIKGDKAYVVGFTTSKDSAPEVERIADQSIKTFHFE
ncbi:MAG TPA: hypothetical protein VHE55_04935 [Fimbriimonadaceae bacterium]|nr:hypothetical protein [Fimbriimonadaceae bacterium]